jgi:hypothetical protein
MNYAFHMILVLSMLTMEIFSALEVLDYRTR